MDLIKAVPSHPSQGNSGLLPKVIVLNTDLSYPESASSKDFLLSPQPRARRQSSQLPAIIFFTASLSCPISPLSSHPGQGSLHTVTEQERYVKASTFHPMWDIGGSTLAPELSTRLPEGLQGLDGSSPSVSKQSSFLPLPFMVLLSKERFHSSGFALVSANEESKIFLVIAKLFNYAVICCPEVVG